MHTQQAGLEWHEDLQNLGIQQGLKGRKLNRVSRVSDIMQFMFSRGFRRWKILLGTSVCWKAKLTWSNEPRLSARNTWIRSETKPSFIALINDSWWLQVLEAAVVTSLMKSLSTENGDSEKESWWSQRSHCVLVWAGSPIDGASPCLPPNFLPLPLYFPFLHSACRFLSIFSSLCHVCSSQESMSLLLNFFSLHNVQFNIYLFRISFCVWFLCFRFFKYYGGILPSKCFHSTILFHKMDLNSVVYLLLLVFQFTSSWKMQHHDL
jgi:hypothetical protein